MGGWIQYSFGPTVGAWLAQHFDLHWRYSRDRAFLEERAYPWVRDVAVHLDAALGARRARPAASSPLSSSPEIFDNSAKAWFARTTNFDLALISWTFQDRRRRWPPSSAGRRRRNDGGRSSPNGRNSPSTRIRA